MLVASWKSSSIVSSVKVRLGVRGRDLVCDLVLGQVLERDLVGERSRRRGVADRSLDLVNGIWTLDLVGVEVDVLRSGGRVLSVSVRVRRCVGAVAVRGRVCMVC